MRGVLHAVLFFPLRTDASDVRGFGTAAIVIANVAVVLLFGFVDPFFDLFKSTSAIEQLIHDYGVFKPWQWVTSAFTHGDIAHLASNMIFLITFGLIIERHLGWFRFLCLYFVLTVCSGATETLLFRSGGSYGASGAVFGLIAMAWIWEPQREVTVFIWVWRYVGTHQVTVRGLAMWWIGWQVFYGLLQGFSLSTPVLHLVGAGVGLAFGLLILRCRWIDTEGEDRFSLRDAEREREKSRAPYVPPPPPQRSAYQHAYSWIGYLMAVTAASLIAVGLLLVNIVDWASRETRDGAVGRTVIGFVMIGCGAWLFRKWQLR